MQTLIENRLEQAEPFAEDLVSDEFLIICFRRYVKLIPLFREDGGKEEGENLSQNETDVETINHQKEIENVLEWGDNVLYPLLQNEALEEAQLKLITTILEDILYVSDNMIIIHLVNNAFHFKIGRFVLKLLSTSKRL